MYYVYHIENPGIKKFVKNIKIPWIQRGAKNHDISKWPFQLSYRFTMGGVFLNLEFHWCDKISRNTLHPNYLEFQGAPQNNRFTRKTEIVYGYPGDEGFLIFNRGYIDINYKLKPKY